MLNSTNKQLLAVCRQLAHARAALKSLPDGSSDEVVFNALYWAQRPAEDLERSWRACSNILVTHVLGIKMGETVVDFGLRFQCEDTDTTQVVIQSGRPMGILDMETPDAELRLELDVTLYAPGTSRHGRNEVLQHVVGDALLVCGQASPA